MRVLCAIDLRHGVEVVQHVLALTQGTAPELLLAHVVDTGQRPDPERRGPLGRGPHHDPARERAMTEAEMALAQEIGADLIALRLNEFGEHRPTTGPGSVGHTARFVLDHAPCDVLLIRM